jgi:hypothetical protein
MPERLGPRISTHQIADGRFQGQVYTRLLNGENVQTFWLYCGEPQPTKEEAKEDARQWLELNRERMAERNC